MRKARPDVAIACIGLGSNLAHPRRQIARALRGLARLPRSVLVRVSPNFVTAPVGATQPQPDYVNAVAILRTSLPPRALLARLHAIERRQRRVRKLSAPRNAARTLDLDLLLYERRRRTGADLVLPHPRMHERAFVLLPLSRIAPAITIAGRGLARRYLRAVRGQSARPTRSHRLH